MTSTFECSKKWGDYHSCFWRCQEGPVSLTDQPRVLASFLADLQRICIHRGYAVESDPIAEKESEDD